MKGVFLQPAFIVATLFILAIIAGVTYASVRIRSQEGDKDALVKKAEQLATGHASAEQISSELTKARTVAESELERLNLFTTYPSAPETLAVVREEVYDNVFETIAKKIETLKEAEINLAQDIKSSLQEKIVAKKAEIQEVLKKWEKLIKDEAANSNPTAAAEASTYAEEIRADIQDLKNLVDQLTTENSGLTPTEIAADKADVAAAIKQTEQAVSDLGQTSVPQAVVQQQQQDVANAQNQVERLEQDLQQINNPPTGSGPDQTSPTTSTEGAGNASTVGDTTSPNASNPDYQDPASPNYPGTRYVPPAPVQDLTKPKLIEGANGVL